MEYECGQIGWLLKLQNLECDSSNLEIYSLTNKKPMQIRRNKRLCGKNEIFGLRPERMYFEQAVKGSQVRNRCAVRKRVTVVKTS